MVFENINMEENDYLNFITFLYEMTIRGNIEYSCNSKDTECPELIFKITKYYFDYTYTENNTEVTIEMHRFLSTIAFFFSIKIQNNKIQLSCKGFKIIPKTLKQNNIEILEKYKNILLKILVEQKNILLQDIDLFLKELDNKKELLTKYYNNTTIKGEIK
jgi:hypothetical protein